MGLPAQLTCRPRRGAALASALLGLVVVTMLASGIFSMSTSHHQAARNREDATRALLLAENAVAHGSALVRDSLKHRTFTQLLRGADGTANTADDGVLSGHGLSTSLALPATGKTGGDGTYFAQVLDDPAETDGNVKVDQNKRFILRCRGVSTSGATSTVDVTMAMEVFPAMATEGNLTISGNPKIIGLCGGAHANAVALVTGTPIVSGPLSASDTVKTGIYTVKDTANQAVVPLSHAPALDIPDMNPADYCGATDYQLNANGTVTRRIAPTGTLTAAQAQTQLGWTLTAGVWTASPSMVGGSYCVQGNAKISGNMGSASSPLRLSIIATGSVEMSGNPYIVPATGDSIAIMAGGDVMIAGNPASQNENFEGLIYAGAQCKIAGNPRVAGQVLCKNKPNPAGATQLAVTNSIEGNPELTYNCGGILSKRKIVSWIQRVQ